MRSIIFSSLKGRTTPPIESTSRTFPVSHSISSAEAIFTVVGPSYLDNAEIVDALISTASGTPFSLWRNPNAHQRGLCVTATNNMRIAVCDRGNPQHSHWRTPGDFLAKPDPDAARSADMVVMVVPAAMLKNDSGTFDQSKIQACGKSLRKLFTEHTPVLKSGCAWVIITGIQDTDHYWNELHDKLSKQGLPMDHVGPAGPQTIESIIETCTKQSQRSKMPRR